MLPYSGSPLVLLVPLLIRVANVIMITMVITSPYNHAYHDLNTYFEEGHCKCFYCARPDCCQWICYLHVFSTRPSQPPLKIIGLLMICKYCSVPI